MIHSVSAVGYRKLSSLNFPLPPGVSLVCGPNGAGKSSLANAIRMGLMGHCDPWTEMGGGGKDALVQWGAAKATINLDMDLPKRTVVTRVIGKGAGLTVGEFEGKNAEAILATSLPPDMLLSLCLSTGYYAALPEKDQQTVLLSLVGGDINADWVKDKLSDAQAAFLEDHLATAITGKPLIDRLDKLARDERTIAGREKKSTQAAFDALPMVNGAINDEERAAYAKQIADLDEQIEGLAKTAGAAEARAGEIERAEAARRKAEEVVKNAKARLGTLAPEPEYDPAALPAKREELVQAEAQWGRTVQQATAAKAKLEAAQEAAEALGELVNGVCVLGGVACPLETTVRDTMVQQRVDVVGEQDAEAKRLDSAADALAERLNTAREEINALDAKRIAHENWQASRDRDTEALARAEEQLAQITVPEPIAIDGDLQQSMADAKAQRAELQRKVQEGEAAGRAEAERNAAKRVARAAADRWQMLEDLVKLLSTKGAVGEHMVACTEALLGQINGLLSKFTNFEMGADEDGILTASLDGDPHLPVKLLSRSELLRVTMALQCVVARQTGFGFVLVDEFEALVGDSIDEALKMLLASGVQCLVLRARPDLPNIEQTEGLHTFLLRDGNLVSA